MDKILTTGRISLERHLIRWRGNLFARGKDSGIYCTMRGLPLNGITLNIRILNKVAKGARKGTRILNKMAKVIYMYFPNHNDRL